MNYVTIGCSLVPTGSFLQRFLMLACGGIKFNLPIFYWRWSNFVPRICVEINVCVSCCCSFVFVHFWFLLLSSLSVARLVLRIISFTIRLAASSPASSPLCSYHAGLALASQCVCCCCLLMYCTHNLIRRFINCQQKFTHSTAVGANAPSCHPALRPTCSPSPSSVTQALPLYSCRAKAAFDCTNTHLHKHIPYTYIHNIHIYTYIYVYVRICVCVLLRVGGNALLLVI